MTSVRAGWAGRAAARRREAAHMVVNATPISSEAHELHGHDRGRGSQHHLVAAIVGKADGVLRCDADSVTSARLAGVGAGVLGAVGVSLPPPQAPKKMTMAIASTAAPVRMWPPVSGRPA